MLNVLRLGIHTHTYRARPNGQKCYIASWQTNLLLFYNSPDQIREYQFGEFANQDRITPENHNILPRLIFISYPTKDSE
ncbi:unnamed protein product [Tenebrio molitor]|nr:unnamed protein product [Tenebrio molitor]